MRHKKEKKNFFKAILLPWQPVGKKWDVYNNITDMYSMNGCEVGWGEVDGGRGGLSND